MEEIIKNWRDLPDDVEVTPSMACFGSGGYGLDDHIWWIGIRTKDENLDIYPLPNVISQIVNHHSDMAVSKKLAEIRDLLKIR